MDKRRNYANTCCYLGLLLAFATEQAKIYILFFCACHFGKTSDPLVQNFCWDSSDEVLPGYKSMFSRSRPQQIIVWRFISTHLPSVTTADDRTQEAHDFYPKNGCDVCFETRVKSRGNTNSCRWHAIRLTHRRERDRFAETLRAEAHSKFRALIGPSDSTRWVSYSGVAWNHRFRGNVSILTERSRKERWRREERCGNRKCTFQRCQYLERVSLSNTIHISVKYLASHLFT